MLMPKRFAVSAGLRSLAIASFSRSYPGDGSNAFRRAPAVKQPVTSINLGARRTLDSRVFERVKSTDRSTTSSCNRILRIRAGFGNLVVAKDNDLAISRSGLAVPPIKLISYDMK